MSGLSSRNKGKAGEREFARICREHFPDLEVERSWQVRGGAGKADVVVKGLPVHFEVKRQKRPNIRAALRQATDDADPTLIPVAATRADRDTWVVTLDLKEFLHLLSLTWRHVIPWTKRP
jgi:hypothetical protein